MEGPKLCEACWGKICVSTKHVSRPLRIRASDGSSRVAYRHWHLEHAPKRKVSNGNAAT